MGAPSMMTNSVQPCEICGDIGFAKAIATCSECHNSREHIYCMRFKFDCVPKSWYCEACRCFKTNNRDTSRFDGPKRNRREDALDSSKKQMASAAGNVSSMVPVPGSVSSMVSYASKARGSLSGKPLERFFSRKYIRKKVETGKVKFIPVESVCALVPGAKPNPSFLQGGPSSNTGSFGINCRSVRNGTSVAVSSSSKSSSKNDYSYKSFGPRKSLLIGHVQTNTVQKQVVEVYQPLIGFKSPSCFIDRSSTPKNLKSVETSARKDVSHTASEVDPSPPTSNAHAYGVQEMYNSENASSGLCKHAGKVDSLQSKDYMFKENSADDIILCEENLPNPPAAKASWKGSFEILNFPHPLYVQAYPPGKVSRKVHLFSRRMPEVLQSKLQPRRDVWPETFHTESPSELDIALYFWAGNFRSSREMYNRLLEWMDKQDLCIKSRLNGAELLVFTSKQLPVESQRIYKQFYLWGVFHSSRGRHSSVDFKGKPHAVNFSSLNDKFDNHTVSVTDEVDDQAVDTEFNMERDREVGNMDKCLRRNSLASCWDNSLDSLSVFHSHHSVDKGTVAGHLHQIKIEQCDDYEVPPGISRFERSIVARLYQMRREQCDDYDAPFSRFERSIVAKYIHRIKREQYDDCGAPPGFSRSTALGYSRPIQSTADGKGSIAFSPVRTSHVAHVVDAPPGFSELIKLKERDSSYEHSENVTNEGDDRIMDMEIDMEAGIEVGRIDICLRRNTMAACWDRPLAALSRVHSYQPVERCTIVSDIQQMEIKQYDDYDAPPGFSSFNALGFARPVTSMASGETRSIDLEVVIDIGGIDKCFHPVEKSNVASNLHQIEIEQSGDYDAPPGFSGSNALGFSRPVTSMAGGEVQSIDMEGKREVGRIDKCLISNSMAACWDNSLDALFRAHSHQPVEKSNVARDPHQMEVEQCDDYDAPPGFSSSNALGFSRPAGGEGPILTSPADISPFAYPVDAPGFSDLIKLKERDPSSKESPPVYITSEASSSNALVLPNQLSQSSDRLNPEKLSYGLFCKICNVPCTDMSSFKQHLAGKRHAEMKETSSKDASVLSNKQSQSLNGLEPLQIHSDGLFCKICKVPCPGIISFNQHLAGKKHAACLQEVATAKISDGLFCKICKVPCPGIISFNQHLAGKKHAARLQEVATAKISGKESESIGSGSKTNKKSSFGRCAGKQITASRRWDPEFENRCSYYMIEREPSPMRSRGGSRFETSRERWVGRQTRMSRHDGWESETKRSYSMMERTPSPRRSRRDGKTRTERNTSRDYSLDTLRNNDQDQKLHRQLQYALPLEAPCRGSRFKICRESSIGRWVGKKTTTSRHDGWESEPKRSYFLKERTPSPVRSRRDGKPKTEQKTSRNYSLDTLHNNDQDQKLHKQLQVALPLENPIEPKSKVGADFAKAELKNKTNELKKKTDEKESNDTKMFSDTTEVLQSQPYFQHEECGIDGEVGRRATTKCEWGVNTMDRSSGFIGENEVGVRSLRKIEEGTQAGGDENDVWHHDRLHELEADASTLARKRPRFRENRREERTQAEGDENNVWHHNHLHELEEDAPPQIRKRPRFREKKIDQESGDAAGINATESESPSCREQPISENSRKEEWGGSGPYEPDRFMKAFTGDQPPLHRRETERDGSSGEDSGCNGPMGSGNIAETHKNNNIHTQYLKHDLFDEASKSPSPKSGSTRKGRFTERSEERNQRNNVYTEKRMHDLFDEANKSPSPKSGSTREGRFTERSEERNQRKNVYTKKWKHDLFDEASKSPSPKSGSTRKGRFTERSEERNQRNNVYTEKNGSMTCLMRSMRAHLQNVAPW